MKSDLVRRVVVAVCAVLAVVGAFVGSGAAGGTPIQEAAGGALSADATLLAPAGPAFSIWSVIYLGLLGYAVWQLLPAQSREGDSALRQRTLGYPVAATLLLNAAWILSVQAGLLALSAVVIVVLLVALLVTFVLVVRTRRRGQGVVESVLVDGTVGLYLGWVCVATAANITALLTADGFDGWSLAPDAWGVTIVVVAGLAGLALAVFGAGRLAPTASLAWGLVWVAVSRTTGELVSAPVATAAVVTATALVVATAIIRLVAVSRERSALGLASSAGASSAGATRPTR